MKNIRLRTPFLMTIAIAFGAVTLLGYFIKIPIITTLRAVLLHWAAILAAVALVIGVLNLLRVHWEKFTKGSSDSFYSLILVISLLITLAISVVFGLTSAFSIWIFNYILIPVEASLVAVLAVALVYTLTRMFSRKVSAINFLFALTVLFILAATATLSWMDFPLARDLRDWVSQVWSLAGARAILIGIALGAIATGLRVLIGADRPYEG